MTPTNLKNPQTPAFNRRRLLGQWALGGVAALALSACGGGGGDGGDDTAAKEAKLREAYDKVDVGMVWTDVEALVGFPANDERSDTELSWVVGEVRFSASFTSTGRKVVVGVGLKVGSSPSITRNIDQPKS